MSDNHIHLDDPLLTAYALGELDPSERERIERLVAVSPAALQAVRDICELAGVLTEELRGESAPVLNDVQREVILAAAHSPAKEAPTRRASAAALVGRRGKWLAGLAAITATVVVAAVMLPPAGRPTRRLARGSGAAGATQWTDESMKWNLAFQGQELEGLGLEAGTRVDYGVASNAMFEAESGMPTNGGGGSGGLGGGSPSFLREAGRTLASTSTDSPPVSDGGASPSRDNSGGQYFRYAAPADPNAVAESRAVTESKDLTRPPATGVVGTPSTRSLSDRREDALSAKRRLAQLALQGGRNGVGGMPGRRAEGIGARDGKSSSPVTTHEGQRLFVRTHPVAANDGLVTDQSVTDLSRESRGKGAPASRPQGLPAVVQTFNQSIRDKDFDLADQIAKEAKESAPDSQVADLMVRKARLKKLSADKKNGKAIDERLVEKELGEITDHEYAALRESGTADGYSLDRGFPVPKDGAELAKRKEQLLQEGFGAETYEPIVENPYLSAYEAPLSTFGVDVDTASYANVRRYLTQQKLLPPPSAVRIEELVNYFSYDYPQPASAEPFSVNVDSGPAPWQPQHRLVRIALKGKDIPRDKRPASNLVFLIDVSGSMQAENKLPLVKMGLRLLTQQMTESDRVAIVTYSDTAVQRLESTNGTNKDAIVGVIESLQANGSTNGAAGIQLAYRAALEHFVDGGTNRVILCTDGDFNVGVTGDDELVQLIQERARTKVFFSVFGFGMGNLKDGKLEKLADKGNGHYAYVDSQREAQKVFAEELSGTLVTIAKDVKIQVEFNPNQVGFYRLIGYENRVLAAQDFNDDRKDAGDIGAGHTVTALYEIIPAADAPKPELGETLRYRKAVVPQEGPLARELLTVKLRFKLPEADASTLIEVPVGGDIREIASESKPLAGLTQSASRDFNWAAAVASFGMLLRDSQFRGQSSFDMILELAQGAKGADPSGRRQEFVELVKAAQALCIPADVAPAPAVPPATPLTREQAEAKASVNGKYRNLLRIVEAPADGASYGEFHDYGRWEGTSYSGQNNLPQGYWVYVAPNWYIWGDEAK